MTPQELKNSILQLAIQDKLVEQRPEEGTAAELLEKILAERYGTNETRGTNGTAKTNGTKRRASSVSEVSSVSDVLNVSGVPSDEKPFDIPESWEWVRLGEIGSWASGATPPRTHSEYYGGSIPWLKTGDLTDGYVSSIPEFIADLHRHDNVVNRPDVGINRRNDGINDGINSSNDVINDVINGVIKFTEKEEIAVKALVRDPRLSAARLADLIGVKQRQAQRIITSLKNKAGLKRRGARKNGEWYFEGVAK